METTLVDTNIFLRYLTKDDPWKYEKCREMFRKAMKGDIAAYSSESGQSFLLIPDACSG